MLTRRSCCVDRIMKPIPTVAATTIVKIARDLKIHFLTRRFMRSDRVEMIGFTSQISLFQGFFETASARSRTNHAIFHFLSHGIFLKTAILLNILVILPFIIVLLSSFKMAVISFKLNANLYLRDPQSSELG